MRKCFIIQPFDSGKYDLQYQEIIVPAVQKSGLYPYRVDEDSSSTILIESIERNIEESSVCIADITENNPNVWYELGFALALRKGVCLICSQSREKFPFDVQHRKIIKYSLESRSNYQKLEDEISNSISSIIEKEQKIHKIEEIKSNIVYDGGLSSDEIGVLTTIMINCPIPGDSASPYVIQKDMLKVGYSKLGISIAMHSLIKSNFAQYIDLVHEGDEYRNIQLSEYGLDWIIKNKDKLLEIDRKYNDSNENKESDDLEDIPF